MYGLPDAPRAWWEEFTTFLKSLGFQHSRLDVAFLVLYRDNGEIGALLIVHVDDIMISFDGTSEMQEKVETLHQKYPFG